VFPSPEPSARRGNGESHSQRPPRGAVAGFSASSRPRFSIVQLVSMLLAPPRPRGATEQDESGCQDPEPNPATTPVRSTPRWEADRWVGDRRADDSYDAAEATADDERGPFLHVAPFTSCPRQVDGARAMGRGHSTRRNRSTRRCRASGSPRKTLLAVPAHSARCERRREAEHDEREQRVEAADPFVCACEERLEEADDRDQERAWSSSLSAASATC
jgi:hypothetical protein